MLQGLLTTYTCLSVEEMDEKLIDRIGGQPDIIYARHVFENSSSDIISLPFGACKPFEKSAELLAPGGFIVVDNNPGILGKVGMDPSRP